ncbi:DUF4113 domain-containing protein, partial [Aeromonas caviae]
WIPCLLSRGMAMVQRRCSTIGISYLADFTPIGSQQGDLFDHHQHKPRSQDLMQMIDRINQGRLGKIHFGSCGRDNSDWMMKREKLSPRYTTALDELPIAK